MNIFSFTLNIFLLVNSCSIQELRITPCDEPNKTKPCRIKRGKSYSLEIDFTPGIDFSFFKKIYCMHMFKRNSYYLRILC